MNSKRWNYKFLLLFITAGKGTKINEKSFISEIQSKRSLWDLSSPGYQRSSEKIVEWERVGNLFNITGNDVLFE